VATVEQCASALDALAARLAASAEAQSKVAFDRTLSCKLRDLDAVFSARLLDGRLIDIGRSDSVDAQIRLTMSSDDLLALIDGTLHVAPAWATGRIRIEAGVRDLIRLRSIF
jgi:hypothetical protein